MYLTTYLRTLSVLRYKQLLQWLPLRQAQDYTPFVVLCHPRSGSTLLHTYLNSHPAIISKGEKAMIDLRHHPEIIDENYIAQKIFCLQPSPIKAVGIKFFVNFVAQPEGNMLLSQLSNLPNLKVILLKRKNPLRIIVSSGIADKTGQMSAWTKSHKLAVADRRIHLSPEKCLNDLQTMEKEFEQSVKLLEGQEKISIYYEELASRQEATLRKVQQFLQVPPRKLFTLLRRQNPEPLSRLISNYAELADHLKENRWTNLLDEQ